MVKVHTLRDLPTTFAGLTEWDTRMFGTLTRRTMERGLVAGKPARNARLPGLGERMSVESVKSQALECAQTQTLHCVFGGLFKRYRVRSKSLTLLAGAL